jgi:hypothetical protein
MGFTFAFYVRNYGEYVAVFTNIEYVFIFCFVIFYLMAFLAFLMNLYFCFHSEEFSQIVVGRVLRVCRQVFFRQENQ